MIEIDSAKNAAELKATLSGMPHVHSVSLLGERKNLLAALQEHEEKKHDLVKRRNKAMAKYL